ncbi:uncharacterized protein LOC132041798 [Lycium ferocissimum]|uniref:uncharacterized protein LOC132041798 n=1 Tax=Lycium ferocissimum TaxID=112874 RepID=UPI00281590C5|nr:uncharacterized protein LOC132041798 [Lycium ferocissimum]
MSCLVSWILLWECEKHDKEGLHPIFCPQCQGTGDGAVYDLNVFAMVERPTQETLYEMRQYKLKLQNAYDAWWESPEIVAKPSIGLRFPEHDSPPPQQGPVSPLCSIKIYKASA